MDYFYFMTETVESKGDINEIPPAIDDGCVFILFPQSTHEIQFYSTLLTLERRRIKQNIFYCFCWKHLEQSSVDAGNPIKDSNQTCSSKCTLSATTAAYDGNKTNKERISRRKTINI